MSQTPPLLEGRRRCAVLTRPRVRHASSLVRVSPPARWLHAAFTRLSRRRPWASLALRLHPAGQRTFTSTPCNVLGTHAGPEPRAPARRLHALVYARHGHELMG